MKLSALGLACLGVLLCSAVQAQSVTEATPDMFSTDTAPTNTTVITSTVITSPAVTVPALPPSPVLPQNPVLPTSPGQNPAQPVIPVPTSPQNSVDPTDPTVPLPATPSVLPQPTQPIRPVMAPLPLLSTLSNVVPLMSLIQGRSAGALYPNLLTYRLGNAGLILGVQGIDTTGTGHVGATLLLGAKLQLTAAELTTLNQLVGNLATQCFNVSPERVVNISDWLVNRNARPGVSAQTAHFGPLDVTYRPWQYTAGTRVFSVVLSRTGTPGKEPWVKNCTMR